MTARQREATPEDEEEQRQRADDERWAEEEVARAQARMDLVNAGVGVKDGGGGVKLSFTDAADLFTQDFAPTGWLIRGLLTLLSVFAVAGEPKTTKTWCALEMAIALVTGTPAFGVLPVVGGPHVVVGLFVEDTTRALRNRLRALLGARGMDASVLRGRLLAPSVRSIDLRNLEDLVSLVVAVRALRVKPSLVLLDPLRDLHGADENSSTEMALVMKNIRALRTVLDASIAFIQHSGKSNENSGKRRGGQRMRGSSVIHGAVDGGLYLSDLSGDLETTWTNNAQAEVKAARGAGFFSLTWKVEDDAEGEALSGAWTFTRDTRATKNAAVRAVVENALADLDVEEPGAFHSVDTIRKHTKKGKPAVEDALAELLQARKAERALTGRGWRRVSDHRTASDPVRTGPEPEDRTASYKRSGPVHPPSPIDGVRSEDSWRAGCEDLWADMAGSA